MPNPMVDRGVKIRLLRGERPSIVVTDADGNDVEISHLVRDIEIHSDPGSVCTARLSVYVTQVEADAQLSDVARANRPDQSWDVEAANAAHRTDDWVDAYRSISALRESLGGSPDESETESSLHRAYVTSRNPRESFVTTSATIAADMQRLRDSVRIAPRINRPYDTAGNASAVNVDATGVVSVRRPPQYRSDDECPVCHETMVRTSYRDRDSHHILQTRCACGVSCVDLDHAVRVHAHD